MEKYGVQPSPNMTKESMNAKLPPSVKWPADNYDHLHEQPTCFYAILFALDRLGMNDDLTVNLAWAYVGLRVAHSLVQSISNTIMVRFGIFAVSSLALAGLTARAVQTFL
ncbi:hypothetical protein LTR86_009121 [Recurvomyces mirabilis]|nr:hypothetical protein LTR86_009121 [Recurvomyces mirabilis]